MIRPSLFTAALLTATALLSVPAALDAAAQSAAPAEKLDIALKTLPASAVLGENKLEVTVKDAKGQPLTDADVTVQLTMTAMPTMKSEVKMKAADGKYTGTAQLTMAGAWDATVTVKKGGKELGQKKVTLAAK